jgi:hypothetical protein
MDGWKYWMEKKVFIILKNHRQYSGKIIEITDEKNDLVWISLIDKFNNRITFVNSEIDLIQEERE